MCVGGSTAFGCLIDPDRLAIRVKEAIVNEHEEESSEEGRHDEGEDEERVGTRCDGREPTSEHREVLPSRDRIEGQILEPRGFILQVEKREAVESPQ